MKYTKEHLLECIRKFKEENGKFPASNSFYKYGPHKKNYVNAFGSWKNALILCGYVEPERVIICECGTCGEKLELSPSRIKNHITGQVFCSHGCSATFTNKFRLRKIKTSCVNCDKPTSNPKYCSLSCKSAFEHEERIKNGTTSARMLKKYLINTRGNACETCHNDKWNDKPIPIELEHIDGNSDNNDFANLSLICPNCHAQTPTYKNKNKGNGRAYRRQRYKDGKSY